MFRTIKNTGYLLKISKPYTLVISALSLNIAPLFSMAGLTKGHVKNLEQIQKRVFKIMLGREYVSYQDECLMLDLPSLESRICPKTSQPPGLSYTEKTPCKIITETG